MSVRSTSFSIIPYVAPKTPMEFIQSEIERGLKNGTITSDHLAQHPIPSELIVLNLDFLTEVLQKSPKIPESSLNLKSKSVKQLPNAETIFEYLQQDCMTENIQSEILQKISDLVANRCFNRDEIEQSIKKLNLCIGCLEIMDLGYTLSYQMVATDGS